jgi:hypothetical protein
MVFDFVDNASQYNASYSMHRLFKLKDYHAGGTVLGRKGEREAEADLYAQGERPDAVIDYPVHATDYELVDIFNWQEEVAGMYSQLELVRHLSINKTQTIEEYIKKGKIIPDLVIPFSSERHFNYFKKDRVEEYADAFGWTIITSQNKHQMFIDMVEKMTMDHSYKPVLLKAILTYADANGRAKISDIVSYFRAFYESRRTSGLIVEKEKSVYYYPGYTDKQSERNILSNPFKRFEDMDMFHHTKTLGIIEVDPIVWKKLTDAEKKWIEAICDERLEKYYQRIIGVSSSNANKSCSCVED